MRHEPVALAQLGFLLDAALGDLVAEQPGADLEAAEAVLSPSTVRASAARRPRTIA